MIGKELRAILERMQSQFQAMREETNQQFAAVQQQFTAMQKQFDGMQHELAVMREENTAAHKKTRRHFDITAEDLRHKIELVSEGVENVDQRLTREAADIRDEMREGFAEVHNLLRLTLDSR